MRAVIRHALAVSIVGAVGISVSVGITLSQQSRDAAEPGALIAAPQAPAASEPSSSSASAAASHPALRYYDSVANSRSLVRPEVDQPVVKKREAALADYQRKADEHAGVVERARAEAEARKKAEQERRKKLDNGYDPNTAKTPREIGQQMAKNLYGWEGAEWVCYDKLIKSESQWITTAKNPSSGAYGIPQSLPASKLASAGPDWRTNPATQIKWGLRYVQQRFKTPCRAWSFKQANNWY